MCDLFFVVQLHIDHPERVNVLCVIPSTWVVIKNQKKFALYPNPPYSSEDFNNLLKMVEARQAPPKWPMHAYDLKKSAYSFHEAQMYVNILTNGKQNNSNEDRIRDLLDVEDYRPEVLENDQISSRNKRHRTEVRQGSQSENAVDHDVSEGLQRSLTGLGEPSLIPRNSTDSQNHYTLASSEEVKGNKNLNSYSIPKMSIK